MPSLPPKHSNEEQRVQALQSYGILDTPPEADFDAIAELIAYICDTPVALVSLVDRDRQWFKATCGLDVRETPLEPSLCAHAILEEDILVIPDMRGDSRCKNNPYMHGDPYLQFYAAALLKTEEGLPLGTLCVMDYRPRYLEERQIKALKSLAKQTMALVTLRRESREARLAQAKLQRAMEESHHRIKNNLQVLASLVEVQRFKHLEQVPQSELQRLSEHIQTLGALHDLLTGDQESATEGHIQVSALLNRIMPLLETTSGGRKLSYDAPASLELSVQKASSFLTLLAELVGNAIKHGEGAISVEVRELAEGVQLTVADEGKGFATDFSAIQSANTGLDLIESMARWDLGGEVHYENGRDGGAQVSVTFPR